MTDYSNAIKILYQSEGEGQIRFKTLEFFHPTMADPIRIYLAGVDNPKNFRLEADAPRDPAASVEFMAASFELNDPDSSPNQNSSISINLGIGSFIFINEILDGIELDSAQFLNPIEAIYRVYHQNDIDNAPSVTPTLLYVNSISMDAEGGTEVLASTTNNNLYRSGSIYTTNDFPGLLSNV